jgi:phosphopantetheinyl transferase
MLPPGSRELQLPDLPLGCIAVLLHSGTAHLGDIVALLPARDRVFIASIRHEGAAIRSALARLACLLASERILVPYIGIEKGEHGAPMWLGEEPINISLTHADAYAMAFLSTSRVCGADLEPIRAKSVSIAPRFMGIKERVATGFEEQPSAGLASLIFSLKESAYKCIGHKGASVRDHFELISAPKLGKATCLFTDVAAPIQIPINYFEIEQWGWCSWGLLP